MNPEAFKIQVRDTLVKPLTDFLVNWGDCDYTLEDIARCRGLLEGWLDSLAALKDPTEAEILDRVRALVVDLNVLNERAKNNLIEIEEREALLVLIHAAAAAAGLESHGEDITVPWREW